MTCREMNSRMADLLLDPASASAEAREHVAGCPACQTELNELKATMSALEAWTAPEPSPFFDTRLYARLREERQAAPAGLLARMREWMRPGAGIRFPRLAAGALAALLIAGGCTFAFLDHGQRSATEPSATVRDLQSYDGEAQLFQQLNALDGEDGGGAPVQAPN